MKVHLIDVGAGASTLIEFSCAAILIDTGGESNESFDSTASLKGYLDGFFAKRPDLNNTLALMITTHNHIDHLRGAEAIFGGYKISNVVTNGRTDSSGGGEQAALIKSATDAGIGYRAISANKVPSGGLTDSVIDPVKCADGDPDIRVLWGSVDKADVRWTSKEYKNANNHSVATRVALGKSSIIITGDLEEDGIAELLKHHAGSKILDSDVYQAGHHGSHNATTKELLDAITPKLALIAVGPSDDRKLDWTSWAYGHPRRVTIEKLEAALQNETRAVRTSGRSASAPRGSRTARSPRRSTRQPGTGSSS